MSITKRPKQYYINQKNNLKITLLFSAGVFNIFKQRATYFLQIFCSGPHLLENYSIKKNSIVLQ